MAVKVQIIGHQNGSDIELIGNEAIIERLQTKEEVVILKDIDGIPLALIPLHHVRFITPFQTTGETPKSFGQNTILNVHIVGDKEGDFNATCNRIEYTRKFDTLNAELLNVIRNEGAEPIISLQAVVPFNNIRYIDFNFVQEQATVPVETDKEVVTEQAQPAPQKRSGGNFSIKGRKNNQ